MGNKAPYFHHWIRSKTTSIWSSNLLKFLATLGIILYTKSSHKRTDMTSFKAIEVSPSLRSIQNPPKALQLCYLGGQTFGHCWPKVGLISTRFRPFVDNENCLGLALRVPNHFLGSPMSEFGDKNELASHGCLGVFLKLHFDPLNFSFLTLTHFHKAPQLFIIIFKTLKS